MVADGTGVKNWCQITFINILAGNAFLGYWKLYINEIAPTFGRVEAIGICSKRAFFYSHSIVALGFGDIS